MKTLTLRGDNDPSSLVIALDTANNRGLILARLSDEQVQVPYLELNFQDLSVSLFNSSDLGLTVDNAGLTTIHRLATDGDIDCGGTPILTSPNGSKFRLVVDDLGALSTTPLV